jgi:hypothetical protein
MELSMIIGLVKKGGEAMITVSFVDEGQDFLEWDLDDDGKVVGCRPFQGDIWIGVEVQNKNIKPGDLLDIITSDGAYHQLIHAVEKVQQPMERLVKRFVDLMSSFWELVDETRNVLNEQNIAPFCQAVAGEMRERGMSEDTINSVLKGVLWGKERWASLEHSISDDEDYCDVTRVDLEPRVPVGTVLVKEGGDRYHYGGAGEDLQPEVFVQPGLSEEDRFTLAFSRKMEKFADIIYGKVIAVVGDPRDNSGVLGWPIVEVKKGCYFWIREIPMGATLVEERRLE